MFYKKTIPIVKHYYKQKSKSTPQPFDVRGISSEYFHMDGRGTLFLTIFSKRSINIRIVKYSDTIHEILTIVTNE